jgi:hypothetical protein
LVPKGEAIKDRGVKKTGKSGRWRMADSGDRVLDRGRSLLDPKTKRLGFGHAGDVRRLVLNGIELMDRSP